jgi:hypothetical protein
MSTPLSAAQSATSSTICILCQGRMKKEKLESGVGATDIQESYNLTVGNVLLCHCESHAVLATKYF